MVFTGVGLGSPHDDARAGSKVRFLKFRGPKLPVRLREPIETLAYVGGSWRTPDFHEKPRLFTNLRLRAEARAVHCLIESGRDSLWLWFVIQDAGWTEASI